MKYKVLKEFAWYKKDQVVDAPENHVQTWFLEKLGFIKCLADKKRPESGSVEHADCCPHGVSSVATGSQESSCSHEVQRETSEELGDKK